MDENTNEDKNAGDPASGVDGAADPGTPLVNPPADPGTPDASDGNDPDPRDVEIDKLKGEVKTLNRSVVNARREGRATKGEQTNYDAETLGTPEGQYAVSLEVADARLRGSLEDRLKLYPEIPVDEIARIRANPWAFAGRKAWMEGDYEAGLDEIELMMADRIEELEKAKNTPDPQDNPAGDPANVTGNPAPEHIGDDAPEGSEEDANLWTMPMDKLEKLKNKKVKELSSK